MAAKHDYEEIPCPALDCFSGVAALIAVACEEEEKRIRETNGRFNVFTTLYPAHYEVQLHTRFLHCLLDPRGGHDFGSRFLELFFKVLGFTSQGASEVPLLPEASERWLVEKEKRCGKFGIIDLHLEHPSPRFRIAIENKIHAAEQERQLESYSDYLNNSSEGGSRLIYLTLNGKESNTNGGRAYMQIGYSEEILQWLDLCLTATEQAMAVHQVILQYKKVVMQLTGKNMSNPSLVETADFVRKNPDLSRYRRNLSAAVDLAQNQYLDEVGSALISLLKDKFHIVQEPGKAGFHRGNPERLMVSALGDSRLIEEPFRFCVEYDGGDEMVAIGLYVAIGISGLNDTQKELVKRMQMAMGGNDTKWGNSQRMKNPQWLLGWTDVMRGLDDRGFADKFAADFSSEMEGAANMVRSYINDLLLLWNEEREKMSREIQGRSLEPAEEA